jgi:hypothetical protein
MCATGRIVILPGVWSRKTVVTPSGEPQAQGEGELLYRGDLARQSASDGERLFLIRRESTP